MRLRHPSGESMVRIGGAFVPGDIEVMYSDEHIVVYRMTNPRKGQHYDAYTMVAPSTFRTRFKYYEEVYVPFLSGDENE